MISHIFDKETQRMSPRDMAAVPLPGTGYTILNMSKKKAAPAPTTLKGWTTIAKFLGTSPSSAQTWAKQGMPVKREGPFTVADPAEIQTWLGQQSHMSKAAHILTNESDITAALKDSISVVRKK